MVETRVLEFTASGAVREAKAERTGLVLELEDVQRVHITQGRPLQTLKRKSKYWRLMLRFDPRAADYVPDSKQIIAVAYDLQLETRHEGGAEADIEAALRAVIESRAEDRQSGKLTDKGAQRGETATLWIARTFMVMGVAFALIALLAIAPIAIDRWGLGIGAEEQEATIIVTEAGSGSDPSGLPNAQ